MKIQELVEYLVLGSMLTGFFLHINKVENGVLSKFYQIESMLKLILVALEIESSRLSDSEIFLEKKFNFPRRQHPNINFLTKDEK